MPAEAVNVRPALTSVIQTGGVAVAVLPAALNGGIIQNPLSNADQAVTPAEPIYVNPISAPGAGPGQGWGTTFTIYPGQTWAAVPGQITQTFMNALTSGHRVSAISW